MTRLEWQGYGRTVRVTLTWGWCWRLCRCAGVVLVDAGPLELRLYTRRMWWEQPW